ncbi:MAG: FG-GAP-like repeat-containing protein, partial [Verrucomicrobiota bacterium]|nr:FG-GAP-like repeat-containing protein [Verrucomicrobiota bacterium]
HGREEWQLWYKTGLQKDTNQVFQNLGHLKFKDVSKDWGLDHLGASYSASTGDLDRDGDLDLVVASLDEPVKIFRNDSARKRVTFSLRGNESNRYGIGAVIRAVSGTGKQTKIMNPMTGYASCNGPVMHFGIGDEDRIDRLEVEWPGGSIQSFENIAAGSHYVVSQSKETSPPEKEKKESGTEPMFAPVKSIQSAPHEETFFNDFAQQPLLPNKLSHLGPGIAVGDTDGDGVDEIVLGSARSEPIGIHHNRDGLISWKEISASSVHNSSEDMSPLLFDADLDGDADLFVVSGGVESGPEELRDRLYLNDGNGSYEHVPDGALPDLMISGSVASAADFDRDGDLDVFVGGRLRPGKYPTGPKSTLLVNETVKGEKVLFTDRTKQLCPEIENCGMVTSALWSDANGDGWIDLLLSIEWGPVRIFINNEGKLKETTQDSGLKEYSGWWNGLAGRDLDGDGDIDYVATNFGLNTKYHPSKKKPSRIYYGTFGDSSTPSIVEAKVAEDCILPVRGKSCSQNAMPFVREKFNTYHKFASATLTDIYTQTALQQSESFEVNYLKSVVFINDGKANFKAVPLPELSQIAPGFGVIATEVNGDGKADIYLAQNFYHPQRETGRMAGGMSVLLLGDGSGSFNEIWPNRSGLTVPEDARGLASCDLNDDGWVDFAVGVNDGKMKLFENKMSSNSENKSFMIRLSDGPGNPTGVGARVRVELSDGSTQTDEVRAGGGYLSQSSSGLFFGLSAGNKIKNIKVRWPDGEETDHQYSSGNHKVIITRTAQ